MNTTGWLKGLRVTADGTGIVSHAGVALLRALADNIGLTAGLSEALAAPHPAPGAVGPPGSGHDAGDRATHRTRARGAATHRAPGRHH